MFGTLMIVGFAYLIFDHIRGNVAAKRQHRMHPYAVPARGK